MVEPQALTARVSPETKRRVGVAAALQLITTSVWLRRVIAAALGSETAHAAGAPIEQSTEFPRHRLSVRIPRGDALLLKARALARGMNPSTYVSVLIRSHLRSLSPLPKRELLALRRTVSELGAIARNLRCISSVGDIPAGQQDLLNSQRLCEALRNDVKALIKANASSWDLGHPTDRENPSAAPVFCEAGHSPHRRKEYDYAANGLSPPHGKSYP